ncbi:GPO family capsid scaffolding protein [Achromobacter mucicolens]|uniref:GPO family capsid scaffolding protein n=1 Tax=Achromobacter mucicolens TaxID=1389922 RepID=UPI001CBD3914|nr:GPO family capsid scaffolding protein [Achromobacter mucicolens]MDH1522135.1 GPO family capsid scaffolding protein [Achromobacter mucicolens]UAN04791.1 GPO family capsid scaffolding protein [Achromobacter mucicolens]
MDKTRWFTVATEGQTTDGRNILRAWLEQIAETYNRETYGARIWMEHIRGLVPESPFKAYGDVLAVRTQENSAGKLELQAQLDPTPELVAMTKGRQKIYTSIELQENFAGTGKCGLVGLGVTDSPASLGTTILEFAAKNPAANPLASRKQSPSNLFSSALETALDFDADPMPSDEAASAFQAIGAFFRALLPGQTSQPQQQAPQQPAPATFTPSDVDGALQAFGALEKAIKQSTDGLAQSVSQLAADLQEFKKSAASAKDLADLRADLDKTPGNFNRRPQASGGADRVQTDC